MTMKGFLKNKILITLLFFMNFPYLGMAEDRFLHPSYLKDNSILLASKDENDPQQSLSQYKEELRKAMEALFKTLDTIEKNPTLTMEEKKQKALAHIENFRWGPEEKYYFWVNDIKANMIIEPGCPFLEGKNFITFKDLEGKLVFVEFIKLCQEQGQGFVEYFWQECIKGKSYPKISMVKLFEPWIWIVGTGIYFDTIEPLDLPIEPDLYSPIDDSEPASGI